MADDKQEQNRSRHRHHCLFAVCRLPETRRPGFACLFARASDRHAHRARPAIWIWITSEISFSMGMQRLFKANLYYSCPRESPSTSELDRSSSQRRKLCHHERSDGTLCFVSRLQISIRRESGTPSITFVSPACSSLLQ